MNKLNVAEVPLESAPIEVRVMTDMIEKAFAKTGRIGMTIGGVVHGEMVIIDCQAGIPSYIPAQVAKDITESMLVEFVKNGAAWVAFFDEAWTVHVSPEKTQEAIDAAGRGELNKHPDRVEVMVLTVSKPEGEWFASAEIVRERGKPATLKPWTVIDHKSLVKTEGRFTGLWKKGEKATMDNIVPPPSSN